MTAPDLRVRPPRSPYATLLGLYMLPRTLDKARAILAGTQGAYEMPGLSAILLAELGIAEDELFGVVRTGANDAEIAAWIAAPRPRIDTERVNAVLHAKASEGNDFERLARDYYPWLRARPLHRWMDIALADDEMTFPPQPVDALFTPLRIRDLDLANRFVMSPMNRNRSPSGIPGEDVARYYRRRAEGETALIFTGARGSTIRRRSARRRRASGASPSCTGRRSTAGGASSSWSTPPAGRSSRSSGIKA